MKESPRLPHRSADECFDVAVEGHCGPYGVVIASDLVKPADPRPTVEVSVEAEDRADPVAFHNG